MNNIGELYQSADWKTEKHVPVIECPDTVKSDELFSIKAMIGKEIAHPNTTEHHIRWITIYFHPEGDKFPYEIGRFEFSAHGESAEGPNKGPVYTNHEVTASLRITKPGTIYATSLCNIHGLWQSAKEIKINQVGDTGFTGPDAKEVVDNAKHAQMVIDKVRTDRHIIARYYEALFHGCYFDPTNTQQLSYAQDINIENYLYVAVTSFGLIDIAPGAGGFMIIAGIAICLGGFALLRLIKKIPAPQ